MLAWKFFYQESVRLDNWKIGLKDECGIFISFKKLPLKTLFFSFLLFSLSSVY